MCVIIYKPAGVVRPSGKIFSACWQNNPHGAGFAYRDEKNGVFRLEKGFMTFENFMDAVFACTATETEAVYHLRIATSGAIDARTCHPFPLSSQKKLLTAVCVPTKAFFAHNGILGYGDGALSDSQVYVRDWLAPLYETDTDPITLCRFVNATTQGSRCVVGDIRLPAMQLTGKGWIEEQGIYYSNDSFLLLEPVPPTITPFRL